MLDIGIVTGHSDVAKLRLNILHSLVTAAKMLLSVNFATVKT